MKMLYGGLLIFLDITVKRRINMGDFSKQDVLKNKIWKIENQELITLLINRKGGKTTMRILDELLIQPLNKNELCKTLELDYKTITYHINIIRETNYVEELQFGHVKFYRPSKKLFKNLESYYLIKDCLKK